MQKVRGHSSRNCLRFLKTRTRASQNTRRAQSGRGHGGVRLTGTCGRQPRVRPVAAAPRLAARKGNNPMVPRLRDGPSHRAGADEETPLIGRKERAAATGTNPENTARGERKPGSRRHRGKTPRVPDVQKRQVYRTGRRPAVAWGRRRGWGAGSTVS